ncbi:uncharacterized protein C8Q71DRAFT_892901 [Rhodofomes roseus]|uniref:Sensitive to high expression protein 9, mitochondrial n=1 Tax=Rhodofomes roseus TaxID=34475 RepID=A0ABQ8K8G6_9APHY|nr:uncharacterized protein C8Q71DRAFT_875275 [Rhodofomes roseus]XP_047781717.1 uncharacterized protein C8Q71DRAFT_892901 [Rhodofomes roseus]KAH9833488.1 hypothetical protein C8Q71DRAFT_875275 [Rhodofomes roseus]KAH9840067.1 hypothetical protein C8Q71DRAFT_892901 [Rhodofomes roseus]
MHAIHPQPRQEPAWSYQIHSASPHGSLAVMGVNMFMFALVIVFVEAQGACAAAWVQADGLTNGNVFFVSSTDAGKDQLAYVNDAGDTIMMVDNSSTVTVGQNCNSINTSEGMNQVAMNQMVLHTGDGCTHSANALQTDTLVNSTDCSKAANENEGCMVTTPTKSLYGVGLAADGGGVFITEFANEGISIWFFNRSSVPTVLQSNASTINLSDLGTPTSVSAAGTASTSCASRSRPRHPSPST